MHVFANCLHGSACGNVQYHLYVEYVLMHVCVYIDMHVQRRHVNLHEPIQNTMLSMRLQRKKRNQVSERERERERPTKQC